MSNVNSRTLERNDVVSYNHAVMVAPSGGSRDTKLLPEDKMVPALGTMAYSVDEQPFPSLEVGTGCKVRRWLYNTVSWSDWVECSIVQRTKCTAANGVRVGMYVLRMPNGRLSRYLPAFGEIWAPGSEEPRPDVTPWRRTRTLMNAIYAPIDTIVAGMPRMRVYYPALYLDLTVEDNQRSFEVMFLDGPARGKSLTVDRRYPLSGAAARYLVENGCCVYQFWEVIPARSEGAESRPWDWELDHTQRLVWCQRTLKELEHSLRHAVRHCQCYLVRPM